MSQDELKYVEVPAIAQLRSLGWQFISGGELTPAQNERPSYRDVVLTGRLTAALKRLNPWLNDENLRNVTRLFTHPQQSGLMEYNRYFYKLLQNDISVLQDRGKGRKSYTVTIIDYDSDVSQSPNEFICTSQFIVQGDEKIIPDIVCFVNGLPLAVIECKSPYIVEPMSEGINQLRQYANLRRANLNQGSPQSGKEGSKQNSAQGSKEGAEKLFWYNQLMVSICLYHAEVGTISSGAMHYSPWKDPYPFSDDDILHLRYPKVNTTPFNQNAQMHFDEVHKPTPDFDIKSTIKPPVEVLPQHQLIAGMFSRANFLDLLRNFIVYEVDEGQMVKKVARYQQFRAVQKVIARIKTGLTRRDKSGVVWHTQGSGKSLTMVMLAMKMRHDALLKQYKLVFITDRTQLDDQISTLFQAVQDEMVYRVGAVSQLKPLLEKDSPDIVTAMVQKFVDLEESSSDFIDMNTSDKIIVIADEAHRTHFGTLAATIDGALPNAIKIGFTGTPLVKSIKMGTAFGGYIDFYKIDQAVADGATVPLFYEGREAITAVKGQTLDELFEQYFGQDYSKEEQQQIKQKYGVERAVKEAPARLKTVCKDIIEHYRTTAAPDGYKAMIVAGSRRAALLYKQTLDELGAPPSAVVFSFKKGDDDNYKPYSNKATNKKVIEDFVKPLDQCPITFLIVKDMLLTGFDAKIAQVMYIDRGLKEHTLMQAIARVNRSYKNKSCGYIVDYHGLSLALKEAMKMFSSEDVNDSYRDLKDEIPKLEAAQTALLSLFKNITGDDISEYVLALKDQSKRSQFELRFKTFAKQLNMVLPDKAALPFLPTLRLMGKVQIAAHNRYREKGIDLGDIGAKVQALVDEHIISDGVYQHIAPVDLLDANYKQQLDKLTSAEDKASEMENGLADHININLDDNPAFYKSLQLRLEEIILNHKDNWQKQIELLDQLYDDIKRQPSTASNIGISQQVLPYYQLLEQAKTHINTSLKDLGEQVYAELQQYSDLVDIENRQDIKKEMETAIKRLLSEHIDDINVLMQLKSALVGVFISRLKGR